MYITNVEELVEELKPKLRDYLVMMIGDHAQKKQFNCYVHSDNSPSMAYNPKTGYCTVHCFSCGISHDIFDACLELEGFPSKGADWVTQTLPHLAEKLGVEIRMGESTPQDRARSKLFKLCGDMAMILGQTTCHMSYMKERGWSDSNLTIGQISTEELKSKLIELSWTHTELDTSLMIESRNNNYFGEDKVTFAIRDYRGRAIGFVSRNLGNNGPKYINTPETLVYEKRRTLLGLDTALKTARREGLYIVEGPGDVAAMHSAGIQNVVAVCGTAFTADHLQLLKLVGVRKVYFALDWDEAGYKAIHRILKDELRFAPGVSCYVVLPPDTGETDPCDFINGCEYIDEASICFDTLKKVPAFDWVIDRIGETLDSEDLCEQMIPIVASEETAVRREMFTSALSKYTGISHQSIDQDVRAIRDNKTKERNERLLAAAEAYMRGVRSDPGSTTALMAEYESNLDYIAKEFNKASIGVNYQLNKYEALQEHRARQAEKGLVGEFRMKFYTQFAEAMAGGATWTDGILIYFGGRENSGKTATVIGFGLDVALHDPDAIVLMHFTDDSFAQVEPRIKSNIGMMLREVEEPHLTIGMTNNIARCVTQLEADMYHRADSKFRELIAEEKLIIIDMEDGSTMSTLEKNLRHIRQRYPEKKLLVICDNTHNYMDYLQLDQPTRMTRISNTQKMFTGKYHCAIFATAEYRKNSASDSSKMKLPTNDDLADARALKYRPNMIIHVYNDLNDRMDDAEIFWTSNNPEMKGQRLPRLMLVVSKNKISKFKDKLMLDLDINTVGLHQKNTDEARAEEEKFLDAKEDGKVEVIGGVIIQADY